MPDTLYATLAQNQSIKAPPTMPQATANPLITLLVLAAPVRETPTTFRVGLAELSAAWSAWTSTDVELGATADEVIKKPCWS